MRLHSHTLLRRPGFTLIEVLVAAGLCMLIMSVLAAAFASGIDTFSLLKSTGELNERLKTATTILRNDLTAPHLEAETGEGVKLSQLRFDRYFPESPERFARPQPFGYVRIAQFPIPTAPTLTAPPPPFNAAANNGFAVTYPEGLDPDGLPTTRGMSHVLQMTVKLAATRNDRVAGVALPQPGPGGFINPSETNPFGQALSQSLLNIDATATRFTSQWYEVSYFLTTAPTGTTAGGLPVYALYRRVRAVLPKNGQSVDWAPFAFNAGANTPNLNTDPTIRSTASPGMSFRIGPPNLPSTTPTFPLNTIADLTNPNNRTGGLVVNRTPSAADPHDQLVPLVGTPPAAPTGPVLTGEDLLLSNVISFEVRVSWDGNPNLPARVATFAPPLFPATVPSSDEPPFTDLPSFISTQSGQSPKGTGNPIFMRVDAAGNPVDANGTSTNSPAAASTLRVFDTWANTQGWDAPTMPDPTSTQANPKPPLPNPNFVPLPIRVKAVQIKLRVYDPKNRLTRQVTLVQDL